MFVLGAIHCLKSILKALEDSDETANDIDFLAVLESQRRNLSNPELANHIVLNVEKRLPEEQCKKSLMILFGISNNTPSQFGAQLSEQGKGLMLNCSNNSSNRAT